MFYLRINVIESSFHNQASIFKYLFIWQWNDKTCMSYGTYKKHTTTLRWIVLNIQRRDVLDTILSTKELLWRKNWLYLSRYAIMREYHPEQRVHKCAKMKKSLEWNGRTKNLHSSLRKQVRMGEGGNVPKCMEKNVLACFWPCCRNKKS